MEWGTPGQRPDLSLADCVTLEDVRGAAHILRGHAYRTPVLRSEEINARAHADVVFKPECLQRTGAFKFRGAFHSLSRLTDAERARGVLTYSSGNHGQAVACAAAHLGIRVAVVMPADAAAPKLAATRAYAARAPAGSRVVVFDPAQETREAVAARLAAEVPAERRPVLIPPYDHPHVIAGQGTAALELIEDAGPLDALYVCCGGGGLLSGSAVAAKGLHGDCRVIGVEPELADDATRSFRTGELHVVRNPPTIADGTRTPFLGRHTFPLLMRHVDEMVTVSERALAEAMSLAAEHLKLVVEPSGVLGLAGLLLVRGDAGRAVASARPPRIGVVLSGGNVDMGRWAELVRPASAAS